jgi:hypothetical protein
MDDVKYADQVQQEDAACCNEWEPFWFDHPETISREG